MVEHPDTFTPWHLAVAWLCPRLALVVVLSATNFQVNLSHCFESGFRHNSFVYSVLTSHSLSFLVSCVSPMQITLKHHRLIVRDLAWWSGFIRSIDYGLSSSILTDNWNTREMDFLQSVAAHSCRVSSRGSIVIAGFFIVSLNV